LAARADPHEYDYGHVLKMRRMSIEDAGNVAATGKLASPPELLPTSGKPLEELLRELHDARACSRRLLAPYRDQDLRGKFFLHRLFGPITLYERLAIIAYHDLKHLDQMERALARLKDTA
jgi:DinB family protein